MRVESLEAYNISADILAIWREKVGDHLLPVQEKAVKEFGLFSESNLIVFSPTSSGKTFIGEMAMVKAARSSAKVFYLVPQKALAQEKFEELRDRYAKVGIKVVVSSRDRREFDADIATGKFEIAIVVFEKLAALLVGCPQLLQRVGLVVVDELQLITDESRGPGLELLLTKLKTAKTKPRILGLSAVLGKAQLLADWLDAKLLVDTRRPVELRKGILCRGSFRYREHNSCRESTEPFADAGGGSTEALLIDAAEDLIRRKEQVLIFVADRKTSVDCARILADRINLPAAEEALDELRSQEETHGREKLRACLSSSIAFHNSDLSPEERSLVERNFRSGSIRALFSTTTLSMGMNLPVKNVLLQGTKWHHYKQYQRWDTAPISRSEYENMSGRAGRLGFSEEFGRSILVTNSSMENLAWFDKYVDGDFEAIVPTLETAPLQDLVIDILASGLASTDAELQEMLLCSYTGATHWTQQMTRDELKLKLVGALDKCLNGGLVVRDNEGLNVTNVGFACAAKGIGVDSAVKLATWARNAKSASFSEFEALLIASLTPAGDQVHVSMDKVGRWRPDYKIPALEHAKRCGVIGRAVFLPHLENGDLSDFETSRAFKKALILNAWIEEVSLKEIEERYLVWSGAIRRIGEDYAWIIESMGAIAHACGWPEERLSEFSSLSKRLSFGVFDDAVGIASLRVTGLGRTLARRLVKQGFCDEESLRAAGEDAVRKALNHRRVFEHLWLKVKPCEDETVPLVVEAPETQCYLPVQTPELLRAAEPVVPPVPICENVPVLLVDLKALSVRYRGYEIATRPPNHLQRTPLLALAVLASRAGELVSMAQVADGLVQFGNLKKTPVAPDARDLRYKVLRPFKKAVPSEMADSIDDLIESIPGVGLRLTCMAVRIPEDLSTRSANT